MSIWDLAAAPSRVKENLWNIELTQHFQLAGLVIFIYDYFLTLSDEIRYIWSSKWTLVKIGFLMNRYISLAAIINSLMVITVFTFDVPSCQREVFVVTILGIFVSASWKVLLALRVYALWGARRSIGIALGIAFACSTTFIVIAATPYASRIARTVVVIKDLNVCVPGVQLPRHYFVVWLPSLSFETVVFLMMTYKLVGPVRRDVDSIASLIMRDGVIYFVTIFGARVATITLFIHRDPGLACSSVFLMLGLGSTLISRMALNLRACRTDGTENPPVYPWRHLSLSHLPQAISDRTSIPALGTGTGPSAGTNPNHVYFGSQPYVSGNDALEPNNDFAMLGSKHDIPLKNIDSKA